MCMISSNLHSSLITKAEWCQDIQQGLGFGHLEPCCLNSWGDSIPINYVTLESCSTLNLCLSISIYKMGIIIIPTFCIWVQFWEDTSRAKLGCNLPLVCRVENDLKTLLCIQPAPPILHLLWMNPRNSTGTSNHQKAICCDWKTLKEMECFTDDLIFSR